MTDLLVINVEFNHPQHGVVKKTLKVKDVDELRAQLELPVEYAVTLVDGVVYAAVPGDTLADIGTLESCEKQKRPKTRHAVSVLKTALTPRVIAEQIIVDAFRIQKEHPELIVPSSLPIPMAKNTRRRIARLNRVNMDHNFHSLYDKAIALIVAEG